jgi:hypothetical protein
MDPNHLAMNRIMKEIVPDKKDSTFSVHVVLQPHKIPYINMNSFLI